MHMIPKDQMSTFGPYSFLVTTSGAIQYGVPTIVVLFAWDSPIWAQNPKSAGGRGRNGLNQSVPWPEPRMFSDWYLLSLISPSILSRMLSLLMSLWMTACS